MAFVRDDLDPAARVLTALVVLVQLLVSSCQEADSGTTGSAQAAGSSASASSSAMTPAQSSGAVTNGAPTVMSSAPAPGQDSASRPPAAVSGSRGSAGGPSPATQAGSGSSAGASGEASAGAPAAASAGASGEVTAGAPAANSGGLPAVTDFKAAGPFTPKREAGPSGYVLFYPQELGKDGVKHPILSWGPGAVETASDFATLLSHLASHGFAVISFDATPQGQELVTGIDFLLGENMRADSVFYQKLDPTKISAGGHSAGSLATFVIGGDQRLVTTMHISGGTFDPHTEIMNLHAPALFVCGEPGGDGLLMGDVAHPNCEIDFENATVPVFYGITKGASHMTPTEIGDPTIRSHQLGALVGWLRWQLAGDANAKAMFVSDACTLCSDPAWSTAKQRNLN